MVDFLSLITRLWKCTPNQNSHSSRNRQLYSS